MSTVKLTCHYHWKLERKEHFDSVLNEPKDGCVCLQTNRVLQNRPDVRRGQTEHVTDGGKFLTMFCAALMIPGMILMMILLQLTQTTSGYHQYLTRKSPTESTEHGTCSQNKI